MENIFLSCWICTSHEETDIWIECFSEKRIFPNLQVFFVGVDRSKSRGPQSRWPWTSNRLKIYYCARVAWSITVYFSTKYQSKKISNNASEARKFLTHCSKFSFFVQKFNFDIPRKLSIFLIEKLVKMLRFWTFWLLTTLISRENCKVLSKLNFWTKIWLFE